MSTNMKVMGSGIENSASSNGFKTTLPYKS